MFSLLSYPENNKSKVDVEKIMRQQMVIKSNQTLSFSELIYLATELLLVWYSPLSVYHDVGNVFSPFSSTMM